LLLSWKKLINFSITPQITTTNPQQQDTVYHVNQSSGVTQTGVQALGSARRIDRVKRPKS
jgi:hypothetical protein